jgi:asparagine synthase (glutamine-hydrolysing)
LHTGIFFDIYKMCGIAGFIIKAPETAAGHKEFLLQRCKAMTDSLKHRGPDGEGQWVNYTGDVCFGHRRLSIIDLSPAAAQPMHYSPSPFFDNETKRYSITHNGEVYNYLEVREELYKNGYRFKSQSDTEVILAAYDFWKEDCLQQFDGMFAFAIWDEQEQVLFAARDRFGEKPFYFYTDEQQFIFASEMKAMWAIAVEKRTDEKMLLNYLALGYVQNANDKEQTFFENIYSLPPGHFLSFNKRVFDYQVHPYWSINKEETIQISAEKATDRLAELLNTSVKRRLRSDVPIGSSLSGGLDSSSIAAIVQEFAGKNKKQTTFSAVFPGFEKDESLFIKELTEKFHLTNFRVAPNAEGLINDFEKLCWHQEEPFPSSSIYAQYKVFELAKKQNIKVLLDGQGADETLAGYNKYIHWFLQQLVNRKRFSEAVNERKLFRKNNMPFSWSFKNYLATYLPAHAAIQLEKNEYSKIINHPGIDKRFIRSLHGREWEGIYKPIITKLNDILYFNTTSIGLEELLRFADRSSMAHGREVRLPFLNHELVEFIFSLPADYKIHNGATKWLLRKAMDKKLPAAIVWRKDKVGFEPPQQKWMNNAVLQEYMQEAKRKLVNRGILRKEVLSSKINPLPAHHADNFDWRYLCAAQII